MITRFVIKYYVAGLSGLIKFIKCGECLFRIAWDTGGRKRMVWTLLSPLSPCASARDGWCASQHSSAVLERTGTLLQRLRDCLVTAFESWLDQLVVIAFPLKTTCIGTERCVLDFRDSDNVSFFDLLQDHFSFWSWMVDEAPWFVSGFFFQPDSALHRSTVW